MEFDSDEDDFWMITGVERAEIKRNIRLSVCLQKNISSLFTVYQSENALLGYQYDADPVLNGYQNHRLQQYPIKQNVNSRCRRHEQHGCPTKPGLVPVHAYDFAQNES